MRLQARHYQLVSGPYSMAVWASLGWFKEEFADAAARSFAAQPVAVQQEMARAAQAAILEYKAWFDMHQQKYLALLSASIELLQHETRANPSAPKPIDLASRRLQQLMDYTNELVQAWEEFQRDPNPAAVFKLVLGSFWTYYCVAYADKPAASGAKTFKWCTWMPDSELLRQDILTSASRRVWSGGREAGEVLLCPTLQGCVENNPHLLELLDQASQHELDFDRIESNLGHIQVLPRPETTYLTNAGVLDQMFVALPKQSSGNRDHVRTALAKGASSFTDLFHGTAQSARFLLRAPGPSHDVAQADPIGVLFLAAPTLGCLTPFFPEEGLEGAIAKAWARVHGESFAVRFHRDFLNVRAQVLQIDQELRAKAASEMAHHSKNMLVTLGSQIAAAQQAINDGPALRRSLQSAFHLATYLGLEFGLRERLRSDLLDPGAKTRQILERLEDRELERLVRLAVQYLLTLRQVVDGKYDRTYGICDLHVGCRSLAEDNAAETRIDPEAKSVGAITEDIRACLIEIYGRLGDHRRIAELQNDLSVSLEKQPMMLASLFICRELVDNMRPRRNEDRGTHITVALGRLASTTDRDWRSLRIEQRVSRPGDMAAASEEEIAAEDEGANRVAPDYDPFRNAETSPGLARFNLQMGADDLRLARIETSRAGSRSKPILVQLLYLPQATRELRYGTKNPSHRH